MTTVQSNINSQKTTELSPSYTLPMAIVVLSLPLALIQVLLSLPVALFGVFLLFQSIFIRLQFTPKALDIYRSGKLIRQFPYSEWMNWEIFWDRVPILFYFREVKSIHFLPILFDPKTLKTCLETYCPLSDKN